MLAGIVTHGYGRHQDVQNDPRFAIVNEPFKSEQGAGNFVEIKTRFMQRRFKLLEQALIIEEQLRRSNSQQAQSVAQHKLLLSFEDLVGDMKLDVSRLPVTLAQLTELCDRLQISREA